MWSSSPFMKVQIHTQGYITGLKTAGKLRDRGSEPYCWALAEDLLSTRSVAVPLLLQPAR